MHSVICRYRNCGSGGESTFLGSRTMYILLGMTLPDPHLIDSNDVVSNFIAMLNT